MPPRPHRRLRAQRALLVLLPLLPLAVPGCATRPPDDDPEALAEFRQTNDPLEPTNRAFFQVHEAVDQAVLEPAARAYRAVLPQPVRTGIRNALQNLRGPVILLNDVLQGNPRRAEVTLGRFMINSTLGIGGLIDVAGEMGVPGHTEDFGQTLATWGLGEGPYLFIPVLGPSNTRDLAGLGVDVAADPFGFFGGETWIPEWSQWTRTGATALDNREYVIEAVEDVRRTSLDPYATIRSAYRQRRQALIENRLTPPTSRTGAGIGTGAVPPR